MRIELSGSLVRPDPMVTSFLANQNVTIADYIAMGYTHFDVICIGKYGGITLNAATSGGKGSYNPGDTSVYGPGYPPSAGPTSGAANIVPGGASGAKAAPLNGLPTLYGRSKSQRLVGDPGIVIIRLTAE
jgi:hypothetical protein